MERLIELKEDVRSFFLWAEARYPDKENEMGLTYMIFDLESRMQSITKLINKRYEDDNKSK